MDFTFLPHGNGQEIYVDIESLNIKKEWIKDDLQAIVMPELEGNNEIYDIYREMFKCLYELGYRINTDCRLVNDDTFFFTPCLDRHINKISDEYNSKKSEKIKVLLLENGISEPYTVTFPRNSFPVVLPELPFVLKNIKGHGGTEKFLIKTSKEMEILKKFYDEINNYDRENRIANVKKQWSFYKDLEFDDEGKSKKGICVVFVDYKKFFHENMRIQKFVSTPTNYNTSLRIITSSSGDVIGATLKYSEVSRVVNARYYGIVDKYLANPLSPYFIGSDGIISNTVAVGNNIILGKDNYSVLEQEILLAHDINPMNAAIPKQVLEACQDIAIKCKREIGAICGLDFIYDREEKAWKYLEEHEYPMLISYAEEKGLLYDPRSFDGVQILDIYARLQALSLTMEKKNLCTLVRRK